MTPPINVRTRVRSVRLNQAAINGPGSPAYRALARAGAQVRDNAKREITEAGLIDTGRLRNSITYEVVSVPNGVTAYVTANVEHALYIHEGTANKGTGYIYPRRARLLRFQPRGSRSFVYARRVKGIKPTPFLKKALEKFRMGSIG